MPATMATSGVVDYELCAFYNYLAYSPINKQALLNWLDVPYVDVSQPWHNSLANDDATINGYLYAICSDASITTLTLTYATFVNSDLIQDYGYQATDLYSMVREGKWTIDKLYSMAEEMYIDKNGNGKSDEDDQYGFGFYICNPADIWYTAFGGKVTGKDEEGHLTVTFMSDKTVEIVTKMLHLKNDNKGFEETKSPYIEEQFLVNRKLVMAPMRFYAAYTTLRNMDDTYSIIPLPKWDEEQSTYYTIADDKFSVFGISTAAYGDIEYIGTIFEALCAESYKTVFPAYYDTALKGKYSSDAESAEMVELIMAGRAFDFSFQFGEYLQALPYFVRNCLADDTYDVASKYKKLEKSLNTSIKKNFTKIYHYDD